MNAITAPVLVARLIMTGTAKSLPMNQLMAAVRYLSIVHPDEYSQNDDKHVLSLARAPGLIDAKKLSISPGVDSRFFPIDHPTTAIN